MTSSSWTNLRGRIGRCRACYDNVPSLVEPGARPLFMKNNPKPQSILFVLEAPNRDDTFNPDKGYLTVDPNTDPSGSFFCDLLVNDLQLPLTELCVTNSVLCLPINKSGRHSVSAMQKAHCSNNLRSIISFLDPPIVCTLGTKALLTTSLIEKHPFTNLGAVASKPIEWFNRILFPLFHTSRLARNGPTGRSEYAQRQDWQLLRRLWLSMEGQKDMHDSRER